MSVVVYRADEPDVSRFERLLKDSGLQPEVQRFGRTAYFLINSNRPDISRLAKAAGQSVRQVHALDELE